MFKSLLINEILNTFPIQEQEEVLNRIGYNLILQVEELQVELNSLDILAKENLKTKFKDFSRSMIIRKIGMLIAEIKAKFPTDIPQDKIVEFVENTMEQEDQTNHVQNDLKKLKSVKDMRNALSLEISLLKNYIQVKQLNLENSTHDYSTQELKKYSDQLEFKLKGLEKRREFSNFTDLTKEDQCSNVQEETSDNELRNMFEEFELLDRPIDLPRMKSDQSEKEVKLIPRPPITPRPSLRPGIQPRLLPALHPPLKSNTRVPTPTKPNTPKVKIRSRSRLYLNPVTSYIQEKNELINSSC